VCACSERFCAVHIVVRDSTQKGRVQLAHPIRARYVCVVCVCECACACACVSKVYYLRQASVSLDLGECWFDCFAGSVGLYHSAFIELRNHTSMEYLLGLADGLIDWESMNLLIVVRLLQQALLI
jgi:hypothetical protein